MYEKIESTSEDSNIWCCEKIKKNIKVFCKRFCHIKNSLNNIIIQIKQFQILKPLVVLFFDVLMYVELYHSTNLTYIYDSLLVSLGNTHISVIQELVQVKALVLPVLPLVVYILVQEHDSFLKSLQCATLFRGEIEFWAKLPGRFSAREIVPRNNVARGKRTGLNSQQVELQTNKHKMEKR